MHSYRNPFRNLCHHLGFNFHYIFCFFFSIFVEVGMLHYVFNNSISGNNCGCQVLYCTFIINQINFNLHLEQCGNHLKCATDENANHKRINFSAVIRNPNSFLIHFWFHFFLFRFPTNEWEKFQTNTEHKTKKKFHFFLRSIYMHTWKVRVSVCSNVAISTHVMIWYVVAVWCIVICARVFNS